MIFKKLFYRANCYRCTIAYKKYSVLHQIRSKIEMTGPLTVADYMREVLTHPKTGYYMKHDVFGEKGDFITSPEISQLFGEILAIWTVNEWQKLGKPSLVQIIELGPGRGTLMKDILRIYSRFGLFSSVTDLSIHLVEVSRAMSSLQAETLCDGSTIEKIDNTSDLGYFQKGIVMNSSIPVYWYSNLCMVPKGFSIVLAHEFFDALPIHKFQKINNEWKEILIDVDQEKGELRYVISRAPTPASLLFTKDETTRDHFEFCPQAAAIMKEMGKMFEQNGGFALIIDYGHEGVKTDTFRAFKRHHLHDPLVEPGTADLTADVDFAFLKKVSSEKLITIGPVTQRSFLTNMHIDVRLEMLLKQCPTEDMKEMLRSGYHMLTDEDKMGERFKVLAAFPLVLAEFIKEYPAAGFQ